MCPQLNQPAPARERSAIASARHTPGPWRFEWPDMFGDCNILHRADSLAVGAVVSNMRPEGEVVANARLIAAAPDMLAALKEARAQVAHLTGKTAVVERINAAIAKAEG
jgi:hypothetical protein